LRTDRGGSRGALYNAMGFLHLGVCIRTVRALTKFRVARAAPTSSPRPERVLNATPRAAQCLPSSFAMPLVADASHHGPRATGTAVNHLRCPVEATSPASRLLTAPLSAAPRGPGVRRRLRGFSLSANTRAPSGATASAGVERNGWALGIFRDCSSEPPTSRKTSRVASMCRLRSGCRRRWLFEASLLFPPIGYRQLGQTVLREESAQSRPRSAADSPRNYLSLRSHP